MICNASRNRKSSTPIRVKKLVSAESLVQCRMISIDTALIKQIQPILWYILFLFLLRMPVITACKTKIIDMPYIICVIIKVS